MDWEFMEENLPKASNLFEYGTLPDVLGCWFSGPADDVPSTSTSMDSISVHHY